MNESLKMVVVLAIIAMISAGILSQVYNITSVVIEENAARALESSVFEVLPGTEKINILRVEDQTELDFIYQGIGEGDQVLGYAFVGNAAGYGGNVQVLVGVSETSNEILNIKILNHTETPGLGSKIEDDSFRKQFVGKKSNDQFTVGQDIDNISGATVSAKAASDAVRKGFKAAAASYKEGN